MKRLICGLMCLLVCQAVWGIFDRAMAGEAMVFFESKGAQPSADNGAGGVWPDCVASARRIPGTGIFRVRLVSGKESDCLSTLAQMPGVVYVEAAQDMVIPDSVSVDDRDGVGGINGTGCVAPADTGLLTDLGKGGQVVVAVLDTGLSFAVHGDRVVVNAGEVPGDGIDNDQNGYVDDRYGWDFGEMDNDIGDIQGHGTHVNAIVLAIAPDAGILPVKVSSGTDVTFSTGDAAEAVFYAVARGADILNLSFSTSNYSVAIATAVLQAVDAGVLVVAAAGNDGQDVLFPASMDAVIAVGAHDAAGDPAWFSPMGPELDLLAPGVDVCTYEIDGSATQVSGTSFSAPAVTGVAAVLKSMNSWLTQSTIKKMIHAGTLDILDPGVDTASGYGNLDAAALSSSVIPQVDVPVTVVKGTSLDVGITLPPTDTATQVYLALFVEGTLLWMDSAYQWFDAADVQITPFLNTTLFDFSSVGVYGPGAGAGDIDTGLYPPGKYLWATGISDKNGKLLAPVGWSDMALLP